MSGEEDLDFDALMDPEDSLDFDAVMRRDGGRPLVGDGRARGRAGDRGRGRGRVRGHAPREEGLSKGATSALAAASAAVVEVGALRAELEQSRQALSAALERIEGARAELAAVRGELAAVQTVAIKAVADRDRLDRERRALARHLDEARRAASAAPFLTLEQALLTAGLREDEGPGVLRELWARRDARELTALLGSPRPTALAAWLDARLCLVCGAEGCKPAAGAVVVQVAPERCEVCGGSDVRRSAQRFFDACQAAGVRRVRIVGGSPTYKKVLQELAEGAPVDIKVISGTARRSLKQARGDQKHADVVILWGATLLDHATSELYDRHLSRVITVAHRGIGRMLQLVAQQLED